MRFKFGRDPVLFGTCERNNLIEMLKYKVVPALKSVMQGPLFVLSVRLFDAFCKALVFAATPAKCLLHKSGDKQQQKTADAKAFCVEETGHKWLTL